MALYRILGLLMALMFVASCDKKLVLDASSVEAFERSEQAIIESLSEDRAQEFIKALDYFQFPEQELPESILKTPDLEEQSRLIKKLSLENLQVVNQKTAEEVLKIYSAR